MREQLAQITLSLMAGTDLVKNFQAAASVVSTHTAVRGMWNEPDTEHGIPESSWDLSEEASRQADYVDLFRVAIDKLKAHRSFLDRYLADHDPDFLSLFPDGIDPALEEATLGYRQMQRRLGEEDLTQDETSLRELVERSRQERSRWAAGASALRAAIAQDSGLIRGPVHLRVNGIKRAYLDLREALYPLSFIHLAKLTRQDLPYPADLRVQAIALSLLAAVTLYENGREIQTHLLTIPSVKALLNQGDPALGIPPHFWDRMEREFQSPEFRMLFNDGLPLLEQELQRQARTPGHEQSFLIYAGKEVSHSSLTNEEKDRAALRLIRGLRRYQDEIFRQSKDVLGEGTQQVSKGFGNLTGLVEYRKGKLFNQPEWISFVLERLEPGDLLLERTPFRLTDKFIPGHFGHVAMYVGTETQLHNLGLWNHPWVVPYHHQIAAGHTIVEALRDGTQINTVEHFLNIDDLAILRPKPRLVPYEDVRQAIVLAFSHVGKKYDFGFDTNTWDTIVCSELAFQTYVNVRWPFAKMLNAYTIAPDDVAVMAGADPRKPFALLAFIQDGRIIGDSYTGLANEALYINVLGSRYLTATP
jgi:hypothetical protein